MSTSFGWEGKGRYGSFSYAGCAGKTVRSLENACHPGRLRGVFTTRRYTNSRLPYLYLTVWYWLTVWLITANTNIRVRWIVWRKDGSTFSQQALPRTCI